MSIADLISRLTHLISSLGILLLLISFPIRFLGYTPFSLWGVVLLIVSPSLSAVMQLGLSRIREFDADVLAAELTGDPASLASALNKIAYPHGRFWQKLLFPGYHRPEPSLLRAHPQTEQRIKQLLQLGRTTENHDNTLIKSHNQPFLLPPSYPTRLPPGYRTIFRIWR
jgi:heat shock protein HtpX